MKVSVMGYGGRGSIYTQNFVYLGVEVVAVCDPNEKRRELASAYASKLYASEDEFFAQGKLSDLLVISTMDRLHYSQAIRAMEIGYDLLLEKPIALTAKECKGIEETAKKYDRRVIVCHVLRYAPFYVNIKKLLDSGKFGKIMTLQQTESVAYYHFAHSYVRGNWRNEETSASVLLAKSCHDLDIITWFMGSKCEKISSFGSLRYFKEENAPKGSTARCQDCPYKDSCVYSCYKIYLNDGYEKIAALARHGRLGDSRDEIVETLSDGKNLLGRCVYRCDNDVCDNQIVNMQFENGGVAQFTLTAFTEKMGREIKITCENGEISGKDDEIEYYFFGDADKKVINVTYEKELYGSHGGGDMGITRSVKEVYESGEKHNVSDVEYSVSSHLMCFAAEKSRKLGGEPIKLTD